MPDKPTFSVPSYKEYTGSYQNEFNKLLEEILNLNFPERIYKSDYTLWSSSPDEIVNRLGWLKLPGNILKELPRIESFSRSLIRENFKNVLLLGMGGSSLAPELYAESFPNPDGLKIYVLDSTDPSFISGVTESVNLNETFVIVSSKSGSTVETISLMNYFLDQYSKEMSNEDACRHFAAITDPGSMLEKTARELNFREIFLNDPDIGGRFSALSFFGLVPASLAGVDLEKLVTKSAEAADSCMKNEMEINTALRLGTFLGFFAEKGIDKLTLVTSKDIDGLNSWIEQLVAESTGKNGKGILPVPADPDQLEGQDGKDRVFVYIKLKGDSEANKITESILSKGLPLITFELGDTYDLGSQLYQWEFATAVACHIMKINPFDQPDVESAKKFTKEFVKEYEESGTLGRSNPDFSFEGMDFYSNIGFRDIEGLIEFLNKSAQPGKYITLQAYLNPSEETESVLNELALILRSRFDIAVTTGFGPRYLHSTGQLHKGDSGNGLFIQLVSDTEIDINIPDGPFSDSTSLSFGVLKNAQAMGDYGALSGKGRSIVSIDLKNDDISTIKKLINIF